MSRSRTFTRLTLFFLLALTLVSVREASAAGGSGSGAVSLTTLSTASSQDFNTLATTGTANPMAISGWYIYEANTGSAADGNYRAGTGSDTNGDSYSFGAAANIERAFGSLFSGTVNPTLGAKFTNNTGATITSLDIAYTGEMWRAGAAARATADRLDFAYSTNATSLTDGTWTETNSLDFNSPTLNVATAGALDGNAAANRTAVSATVSSLSIANGASFWIRWVDSDISGSDDGLAVDDFSITPQGSVSPGVTLSINDVTLNEGDSGTTSFDFTVSLSAPAPAGGVTFDIATANNTATIANSDYTANSLTGQTIAEGQSQSATFSVLVNGDTTVELDETFFVNVTSVTGATVTGGQGQGTITNDDVTLALIHDVQGNGATSPIANQTVTVEGIVVGDYQDQGSGRLKAFFLQEEDADVDADPATSEGVFVYCNTCPTAVAVGDKVRATGLVTEFFNMTQVAAETAGSVSVVSSSNPLPTPATVQLPVPGVPTGDLTAATTAINAYYEPFEGMLVSFPDTLSVSEYFELARYGQVILREDGRPRQFTDASTPSTAGYTNHRIDLATRTVILDDTDNRQNRPVDTPNTNYFHPVSGLSTGNYFRGGDTITNLTGVLHWSFAGQSGTDAWRIRPVIPQYSYAFTPVNTRPSLPDVGGRVTVASFNVLNYFLTVDTTSSSSTGSCGASQTMDCRGADSVAELARQREKLLAALAAIDADVFGFMEMENTPNVEPLADIVAGLPGYDYVDTGVIGTDAIRVGIIYKTATVTPVGAYAILDSSVDPDFDTTRNRPALAQTFSENATGERFTVVVNHFKSKGCTDATGLDADQSDGQSCWNLVRTAAAQALADWLATDPTGSGDADALIIGDLNSYAKEDPITALANAGYTDLVADFGGADAYGYVFDGQLGYLDHALANASLYPQVTGVAEWHINADEIPLFDYNDEVKDTGESTFEEESDTLPLYESNAFRTSDHDPVIVGLSLDSVVPDTMIDSNPPDPSNSGSAAFTFSASEPGSTFECDLDNGGFAACTSPQTYTSLPDGPHTFQVRAVDAALNVDPTPASYTWTIDTTSPDTMIDSNPPDPSNSSSAAFTFSASEPGSTFECDLDNGGFAACTSPQTYTNLPDGPHTFQVRAIDAAGNVDPTPAQYSWTINLPVPSAMVFVAAGNGTADNDVEPDVPFTKGDVVKWDGAAWTMFFDGSAKGVSASGDIIALDVASPAAGSLYLTWRLGTKLPVLGKVQPQDVIYFDGAAFSRFFEGRDVGLTLVSERINGLEVLDGNLWPGPETCAAYLLISTMAGGTVRNGTDPVIRFTGEDVLGFCMTASGADTAGLWHVAFEGESNGLKKNSTLGLAASANAGTLYFTTKNTFPAGVNKILPFVQPSGPLGAPVFDTEAAGISSLVDSIDFAEPAGPGPCSAGDKLASADC